MVTFNKSIVYTCIFGKHDALKDIKIKDPNWEYICFTDQDFEKTNWQIKKIPKELNNLDDSRKARAIKILPHLFLEPYEECVWLDGNIEIINSVELFINKEVGRQQHILSIAKHPHRICVYQEEQAVLKYLKDDPDIVKKQIQKYRDENYPTNWGLVQSGLIYRKNNDKIISLCNTWWNEVLHHSKRDQLSFNYTFWKNPLSMQEVKILNPKILSSFYFEYWYHTRPQKHIPANLEKPTYDTRYGTLPNFLNGVPV